MTERAKGSAAVVNIKTASLRWKTKRSRCVITGHLGNEWSTAAGLEGFPSPTPSLDHHCCSSLVSLGTIQKQTKKIPLFSFRALGHQQDKTS